MSSSYAWFLVLLAGLFEIAWTLGMKYSQGFTRLYPTLFTIFSLALSMFLLAKAAQFLPLGTAYGVWVGIGAFGAALFGILLFNEAATLPRIFFLGLLLISIVGLKVTSP